MKDDAEGGLGGAAISVNPMVEYLTSLRTQEADANPSYVHENRAAFLDQLRARSSWFPSDDELHVATRLDALLEVLADPDAWPRVVVLTGDAGDGKTAFCAKLATRLGHAGDLEEPVTRVAGWVIVKDASEIPKEKLVAEIADARQGERRLLIAINEGRLRRLSRTALADSEALVRDVIEPSLESWMDERGAEALEAAMREHRWLVFNFRHRFHARSVAPALLNAWTRPALWEEGPGCGACPARERCPMLANVVSLRSPDVQARICDLLAAAHFAGQRMPLRRLQAVLALACTGGLRCAAVQQGPLADEKSALDRLGYRYYDVLVRPDPLTRPVRIAPELLCRALAPFDPGRDAERTRDERVALWVLGEPIPEDEGLAPIERAAVEAVRAESAAESGTDASALSTHIAKLTRHLRRERALRAGQSAEAWGRALGLLEGYATSGDPTELCAAVLGGLNALHRQPDKDDSLVMRQLDPGGFREPARLALELALPGRFEARLVRGPMLPESTVLPFIEACPADIYLVVGRDLDADSDAARLHLDARLVAALLLARDGYAQLGALGTYRRDLARFFGHLLRLNGDASPRVILRRGDHLRAFECDASQRKLVIEVDPS